MGVLVYVHVVMNLRDRAADGQHYFTIGVLSNDDVRARVVLGMFLGIPPIFHQRSEITVMEASRRTDPWW